MFKCPECGGETKIIHWTSGQPRYLTCERCGGSGQVDAMTNMEWVQSMNVDELARWMCEIQDAGEETVGPMIEWLKRRYDGT